MSDRNAGPTARRRARALDARLRPAAWPRGLVTAFVLVLLSAAVLVSPVARALAPVDRGGSLGDKQGAPEHPPPPVGMGSEGGETLSQPAAQQPAPPAAPVQRPGAATSGAAGAAHDAGTGSAAALDLPDRTATDGAGPEPPASGAASAAGEAAGSGPGTGTPKGKRGKAAAPASVQAPGAGVYYEIAGLGPVSGVQQGCDPKDPKCAEQEALFCKAYPSSCVDGKRVAPPGGQATSTPAGQPGSGCVDANDDQV